MDSSRVIKFYLGGIDKVDAYHSPNEFAYQLNVSY